MWKGQVQKELEAVPQGYEKKTTVIYIRVLHTFFQKKRIK